MIKKKYKSLICTFSLKNRRFFIILPTKFISLNCAASQNSLANFFINTKTTPFYSKSKIYLFLNPFLANIRIKKKQKVGIY